MSELAIPTPSQTIGPFFRFGMAWLEQRAPAPGATTLYGAVVDGAGAPVPDAVVEIWSVDAGGQFARSLTDDDGGFRFTVVKPEPVVGNQAPHIDVSVFARGLLQRLVTRVYFPDAVNEADAVFTSIPEARRPTLVAVRDRVGLRFDIHLQGPAETVFFAW